MPLLIVMALCWPQTPRAYAQGGLYISSSVDTTGRVSAWSVTNVQDMQHQAYARITLQSPNGRNVSAYRQDNIALGWARADTSLAYDANDLGVYTFRSVHDAYCAFMGWFIANVALNPPGTTVPLVVLSLRNTFGESVSADNAARNNYYNYNGTYAIGTFKNYNNSFWQTSVEITGRVYPSNYTGSITLRREIVSLREYYNNTTATLQWPPCPADKPNCDDTSPGIYRDDDPRPNGWVYDTDNPGLPPLGTENTYHRRRANFRQYATAAGVPVQVSPNFYWWSRLSVWRPDGQTETVLKADVPGDNVSGVGTTKITWDLQ